LRPIELEHYLHEQIPLSRAMAVKVVSIGAGDVVLSAPLAPNTNHHATVFGGSASAVAMLAAWSLLHTRLRAAGIAGRLVIQRSSIEYLRPIAGEFLARAALGDLAQWERFTAVLARRRRARIGVEVLIEHAGEVAARFTGEFVAFGEHNL
jgi:thioesterase domain-containing protein